MKFRYILLLVALGLIISSVFFFTECRQEKAKVTAFSVKLINNEYTMKNNTITISFGNKVDLDSEDFKVTEIYSDGTTKIISQKSENNDGYEFVSTIPDDEITPAGEYSLIFKHSKLNKPVEFKIVVNKETFDLDAVSWDYTSPITYDGTEKEIKITNLPSGVSVSYIGNKATNAGTYSATAIFTHSEANFGAIPNKTIEWKIEKATLEVKAKPHSIVYGDNPANNGVTYSGFKGNDTASVLGGVLDFDYSYTKGNSAGTYDLTPKGLSSINYNFEYISGVLTVNKKDLMLKINNVIIPYNTDAVSNGISSNDFVNGDTIADLGAYTLDFGGYVKGSDVGEYDITIDGTLYSANYNINVVNGTLTVTPIDVDIDTTEIALKTNEFTYDGTNVGNELEVKNLPNGVSCKNIVVKDKTAVDAGDYIAVIYLEYFDTLNYNPMGQIERTFMINKATVDSFDEVALSAISMVYNGNENVVEVENIPAGAKIKTLTGNRATDVGAHTVNVTFVNLNSNYVDFEVNKNLTWNITSAPLRIVAKDKTITYGDDVPVCDLDDVDILTFAGSDNSSVLNGSITFDFTYQKGDDAKIGFYTITPKGVTAKNYQITFVPGCLNVEKAQIDFKDVDWVKNISYVYTGEVIKPQLNFVSNEFVEVNYSYIKVGGGSCEPFNVGTYKASAEIVLLNNNYEIISNNVEDYEFTINPKNVDVSQLIWTELDLTYSGNAIKPTISNAVEGIKIYEYLYTQKGVEVIPINVGSYSVEAVLSAENNNYELSADFIELIYTISARPIDCSIIMWQEHNEYDYDGLTKTPQLINVPEGLNVVYNYKTQDGNFVDAPIDAGDYTAIANLSVESDNYQIVGNVEDFNYKINPKKLDCSISIWQGQQEYILGEEIIKPILVNLPTEVIANYEYLKGVFKVYEIVEEGEYVAIASINPINSNYVIEKYPICMQFNFFVKQPEVEKEIGVKMVIDGIEYIIYKDRTSENLEYDPGRSAYKGAISTSHLFEGSGRVVVDSVYVFNGLSIEDVCAETYREIFLEDERLENFWLTLIDSYESDPYISLEIMGYGVIILTCTD